MSNIVFTGPATDRFNMPVLRQDLINFVKPRGFNVQSSVRADTDLLIASRADTVKARSAARKGVTVLTYDEFFDQLLNVWVIPHDKSVKPNFFADAHDPNATVDQDALAAHDIL